MKRLALSVFAAFALLSGGLLSAACVANTEAFYRFQGNGNDSCQSRTLTQNGTVPYASASGTCATISENLVSGIYSDANYWNTPAALNTAMSGLSAWTIEFYVYFSSLANSPVVWSANDASSSGGTEFIVFGTLGQIQSNFGALGSVATGNGIISTNTCYDIAVTYDGTTRRIYVNGTSQASGAGNSATGTITSGYIGRYTLASGQFVNGYLVDMRFSSVGRSTFPTVDPTGSNQLSPYMINSNSPNMFPLRRP